MNTYRLFCKTCNRICDKEYDAHTRNFICTSCETLHISRYGYECCEVLDITQYNHIFCFKRVLFKNSIIERLDFRYSETL